LPSNLLSLAPTQSPPTAANVSRNVTPRRGSALLLLPEEPVPAWTPPSSTDLASTLARASIAIHSLPERSSISNSGEPQFYAVVTLSCSSAATPSAPPITAIAVPSDLKNGGSVGVAVAIDASAASSSLSRPPQDIICVLDTSGSMSSQNKLTNLLYAGSYIRFSIRYFQ
jgi:hypothetical protein